MKKPPIRSRKVAAKRRTTPSRRKSRGTMQNLVGDHLPPQADLEKWLTGLQSVAQRLTPFTIELSAEMRTRSVRMPSNTRRVLDVVGAEARTVGVAIPNATVDHMERDYTLAQRLRPIHDAASRLVSVLDDTILQAQSECWWAATGYYTILDRMSGADTELNKAIEEVREFFRLGPRPAKAKPEDTATATTASGSAPAADPKTDAKTEATTDAKTPRARKRSRSVMSNLVGDKVPTAAEQQKILEGIEALMGKRIAGFTVSLTAEQRKRAIRIRPNARRMLDIVGAQATRLGITIPNATVDHMNHAYALAEHLAPLHAAASRLASVLDDTILQAQSECWWTATAYYTILDRMSGADRRLHKALDEVRAFFRKGSRTTTSTH